MSVMTAEQFIAAHKSNMETMFGLTNKAFEGVEKLVELNLQVAKTAISEASADNAKAALSAKDAQEFMALQASLLQPAAEKAAAYSRHLYDIAASTGAEVGKVAEATAADAQDEVHVGRRHRRQERAGRQRERRRPGEVGRRRCQQRLRRHAEGRQAGQRHRGSQLPVRSEPQPPRPLSRRSKRA